MQLQKLGWWLRCEGFGYLSSHLHRPFQISRAKENGTSPNLSILNGHKISHTASKAPILPYLPEGCPCVWRLLVGGTEGQVGWASQLSPSLEAPAGHTHTSAAARPHLSLAAGTGSHTNLWMIHIHHLQPVIVIYTSITLSIKSTMRSNYSLHCRIIHKWLSSRCRHHFTHTYTVMTTWQDCFWFALYGWRAQTIRYGLLRSFQSQASQ